MQNITEETKQDKAPSCSTGSCLLSNPRTLSFIVPFLAVLALEQWAASSNTCMNSVVCQMCIVSKTALAVVAGFIGLALNRMLNKA